jgi:hypothetical protein
MKAVFLATFKRIPAPVAHRQMPIGVLRLGCDLAVGLACGNPCRVGLFRDARAAANLERVRRPALRSKLVEKGPRKAVEFAPVINGK